MTEYVKILFVVCSCIVVTTSNLAGASTQSFKTKTGYCRTVIQFSIDSYTSDNNKRIAAQAVFNDYMQSGGLEKALDSYYIKKKSGLFITSVPRQLYKGVTERIRAVGHIFPTEAVLQSFTLDKAVVRCRPEAVTTMIEEVKSKQRSLKRTLSLLENEDPAVVDRALQAWCDADEWDINSLHEEQRIKLLNVSAKHPWNGSGNHQYAGLCVLLAVSDERAINLFEQLLEGEKGEHGQRYMLRTVSIYGNKAIKLAPLIQQLATNSSVSVKLRQQALWTFTMILGKGARPFLQEMYGSPDQQIASTADSILNELDKNM